MNSYVSADGSVFTIVGAIDNLGTSAVLQLGTPGFVRNGAGETIASAGSTLVARPFVQSPASERSFVWTSPRSGA